MVPHAHDAHAAQLAVMQPYWRTARQPPGLSPEDRQALVSNVMPPSARHAGRRSMKVTFKAAGGAVAIGFVLAAAGAAVLLSGGDPDSGPGWPLVFMGGLIVLVGIPVAIGAAVTRRKYAPATLGRVTDTLVDVRRTKRPGGYPGRYIQPLEMELASGLVIEIPLAADDLGQMFVRGRSYRVWYLPAPNAFTPNTLIYVDVA